MFIYCHLKCSFHFLFKKDEIFCLILLISTESLGRSSIITAIMRKTSTAQLHTPIAMAVGRWSEFCLASLGLYCIPLLAPEIVLQKWITMYIAWYLLWSLITYRCCYTKLITNYKLQCEFGIFASSNYVSKILQ